eukprot:GFUD01000383.1.p1 GENE.GFUD01000383.1~~GFUD01000383.1.p1  ORF type:complete len:367 (-),score=87.44 GFUD01000383.1:63-1163(-)
MEIESEMDATLISIRFLFVDADMKNESKSQLQQGDDKKKLEDSDGEAIDWKRQVEMLNSLLEKQKKNVMILQNKEEETLRIHEEEISSLKSDMKEVIDKHKHVFDQLKEKVECPVCMEIPRSGPVYVCPNGHFVCKECKSGSCPTCRVDMADGKSLLAVTIIENIDHQCKFVYCEEFFAIDKLDGHEKTCKHRTVSCPHDFCLEKIALSKLLDHLGGQPCSATSVPIVFKDASKPGEEKCKVGYLLSAAGSSGSGTTWKLNHFEYGDTSFVVLAKKFDHFFHFSMVMLESKEECLKYNIEMEVHEFDSTSQDSEVIFKFGGKPCSIDEDKDDRKYLGLTVNRKGMEKIIRKNKDNSFSLSFSLVQK